MEENRVADCRECRYCKVLKEEEEKMFCIADDRTYYGLNPCYEGIKLMNREEIEEMSQLDCKDCVYYEPLLEGRMYCIKLDVGSANTKVCSCYKEKEKTENKQVEKQEYDIINKAEHYNKGIEVIEIIESHDLNFSEGNVIKYTLRAKHKGNRLQDLKKAEYYLKRLIEEVENE